MIQLDKSSSEDTLIENFSVYIEQDFDLPSFSFPDNESLSTNALKSFLLEQFSQSEPPETQPIPKRLDSAKRSSKLSFQQVKAKDEKSIQLLEPFSQNTLVQKNPLSKSLKKAINVFTGIFKFSRNLKPSVMLHKSIENYILDSKRSKDKLEDDMESQKVESLQEQLLKEEEESKDQFNESCTPQKFIKENINIKSIYKASYKKLSEKKPLLQKILITNFIISIVDTNTDVTLSRPKNIRKKLSRNFAKKKGDSRKAKEFLVKKGVCLVDCQTDINLSKSETVKRVPGRSKQSGISEEDMPLALLTG